MQKNIINIEYELRTLLANLRKTVEFCFFTEVQQQHQNQQITINNILESENGKQFLYACLEILQHQLILNNHLPKKQELYQQQQEQQKQSRHQHQHQHHHQNQQENTLRQISSLNQKDLQKQEQRTFEKLIEDFEYLYETTQLTQTIKKFSLDKTRLKKFLNLNNSLNVKNFLLFWLTENWKSNCLTLCLQTLIADNELKDLYYDKGAFLQSEDYATAFCICVTSLEQNQYNLLSQIQTELYQTSLYSTISITNPTNEKIDFKSKRTGSHPNISFRNLLLVKQEKRKRYLTVSGGNDKNLMKPRKVGQHNLTAIRKTKSLPNIFMFQKWENNDKILEEQQTLQRPRCKTLDNRLYKRFCNDSKPKNIPKRLNNIENNSPPPISSSNSNTNSNPNSLSPSHNDLEDCQPSTSKQSLSKHFISTPYQIASSLTKPFLPNQDELDCQPSTSKQSINRHLSSTPNTRTLSNTSSSSISSTNSINGKHIEIINCDNIKIWTDQGEEASSVNSNSNSISIDFPSSSLTLPKPAKSISPINNFFSTLFGTPQTYTSWSPKQYQDYNNLEAMDACHAFPCNKYQTNASPITSSVFNAFLPTVGKKLRSRKSQTLFEDGISTLDYSTSNKSNNTATQLNQNSNSIHIEVPNTIATTQSLSSLRNTQTLTDYLKMSHLSRNTTDLEKENAHFTISEAVISAIEHIKWAKKDLADFNKNASAAPATDWLEKDQSQNSHHGGHGDGPHNDTKLIDDSDLLEHTPYAESGCYDELSAEIIGLSIISKFTEKELPKVSELKWLVSDEDTPQNLLPMPDNSPTSNPDENIQTSMTRGTRYWAPPRQQIIFTDHPTPNRKALLLKQNYRCAGCGMRVAQQNMSTFRYCTYLGKYHCTGCHRNQMSVIPAKILHSWDFKSYPVSVFAYRLLDQMNNFPLFYVPDLNPALYVQAKALRNSRQKRRQLSFVKVFIKTCRFAIKEQQYFAQIPDYITDDPDLWSLSDFMDVYDKSMERSIEDLVFKCENHIHNCVLCTARGFYCEHCNREQIIFPWEKKTFRCDRCGSCYHLNCWQSMSEVCNKCERINKRQDQDII